MITVKVTYTVQPGFAAQNRQNIGVFLNDFKKLDTKKFSYNVYTKSDGKTFVHLSVYNSKEAQTELLNVESFKLFQQKRDDSGLVGEPGIEVLEWVGGVGEFKQSV
jgi:hypothetical protein